MIRILSIDGGGVRGIIPLSVLYVIEKRLGIPVYKLFDIIAGTSTGAIIAGLLAVGTPVSEIMKLYLGDAVKKIFKKSFINIPTKCPKYDNKNIEEVLFAAFEHKRMGDALTGLIIPADDWSNRCGRIYSSFEKRTQDIPLWEIVRASTAAETYFRSFRGMFDGGLYANNPTDLAIREAVKYKKIRLEDLFIVSLGTGTMVEKLDPKKIEKFWWTDFAVNLIPEIMDRITSRVHDILVELISPIRYKRFQFDCPNEFKDMDDVRDKNLSNLKDLADMFITNEWKNDLNFVIDQLKYFYEMSTVESIVN